MHTTKRPPQGRALVQRISDGSLRGVVVQVHLLAGRVAEPFHLHAVGGEGAVGLLPAGREGQCEAQNHDRCFHTQNPCVGGRVGYVGGLCATTNGPKPGYGGDHAVVDGHPTASQGAAPRIDHQPARIWARAVDKGRSAHPGGMWRSTSAIQNAANGPTRTSRSSAARTEVTNAMVVSQAKASVVSQFES